MVGELATDSRGVVITFSVLEIYFFFYLAAQFWFGVIWIRLGRVMIFDTHYHPPYAGA